MKRHRNQDLENILQYHILANPHFPSIPQNLPNPIMQSPNAKIPDLLLANPIPPQAHTNKKPFLSTHIRVHHLFQTFLYSFGGDEDVYEVWLLSEELEEY